MRAVLSEQAQRKVRAIPAENHEGWQTILDDCGGWLENAPAWASQTEIPIEMDSVQTVEFLGFDGNTAGALYDSWFPQGEDSLLQHAKDFLAEMYGQAPARIELRRLLPAMGLSRAFNDRIWEMMDQVRRDGRFVNATVDRRNIKQWAEVEIASRFKTLQNLNNRILGGARIETVHQASYELTPRNGINNDGVPKGFLKRNGLLQPTYLHFPQLPAGPRLCTIDPAMMANFRATPIENGRVAYVAQEPTGYTVPNSDGTRTVYVGRYQLAAADRDQHHGRGGAPKVGQRQPLDPIFQARSSHLPEQLQAPLGGGQRPAWDGPTPAMQQALQEGYVNQQGQRATPNFGGLNPIQWQAQLGAQLPPANAQLCNPPAYAPIQIGGTQAYAPVWTDWGGNRIGMDAPPPYSAQAPSQ